MPVWSESARHVVNSAPTIHNIINDFNWNTIIRVAVTAFQASTSLAELASDALVAITGYWPPKLLQGFPMPLVVASDNDAWDLILQLVYYANLIFRTVEAAIQITPLQGTNLHAAFVQNVHYIMICAFLAADHLRGIAAVVGFGNNPELLNFMTALAKTNAVGVLCLLLSGLVTVELLCFIIARGCLNMRELLLHIRTKRDSFNVPVLPNAVGAAGWWDCYNKAIPKAVFVCAGSDGGAEPLQPALVITTSQDEWGALSTMQNFATRCRQPLRRLDWNGVGTLRDPVRIAARSL
ncbi:uncharacterized protein FMAN_12107 [Fusarium mangiferae]|uniref:Uncharacterized protein n=1 Tax=Fusarium mangiferae TaxID=192010 RepID=A0A1L7TGV8_FUSMA|nr:uncharacterized protein FMAN_12107 [Fusarium mangiferae]CVK97938.1 uncharacterized protein FMAN_12107 [Fusarium mangiferae]